MDFKEKLSHGQIFGLLIVGIGVIAALAVYKTTPKLSDRELYLSFYNEILQKIKPMDEEYRPFSEALDKRDLIKTAQVGVKIKDSLNNHYSHVFNLEVPDLQNDIAEKQLKEGKELLDYAYMNKIKIVEGYLEFAKDPSSLIIKAAEMKNSGEKYQQGLFQGMLQIMEAGSKLGLTIEEITSGKLAQKEMFSQSELAGALRGFNLTGTSDNEGKKIEIHFIAKDLKPQQVRPTLLAALQDVKQKYSGSEFITVGIAENNDKAQNKQFFASATFNKGNVSLNYNGKQDNIKAN